MSSFDIEKWKSLLEEIEEKNNLEILNGSYYCANTIINFFNLFIVIFY
jgi:hypothetical protein